MSITRITPTVDPRTRMVEVIAEIPNPDQRLKPGMLVEVAFGDRKPPASDAGAPNAPKQGKPSEQP